MKTEIEYKGLKTSIKLEQQINEAVGKITQKFNLVNHAIIYLIKDNGEKSCVCEIEVRSGAAPNIFVKEANGKFEVAIAKAFEVLDRQLRKTKDKITH